MTLPCKPTSTVIAIVALPALLDSAPQILVETPAASFISPDVAINGFVADE
jgi:hypothetical protein